MSDTLYSPPADTYYESIAIFERTQDFLTDEDIDLFDKNLVCADYVGTIYHQYAESHYYEKVTYYHFDGRLIKRTALYRYFDFDEYILAEKMHREWERITNYAK